MKLTNRQIVTLQAALLDLDGVDKPDAPEAKRPQYAGKVLYAVARCIAHLKAHVEAIERAKRAIIRKYSEGRGGVSPNSVKFMDAEDEVNELLDAEVEVTLHTFKEADLDAEKNRIAPSTLADLLPVIEAVTAE
jgi:hypothetical protein